MLCVSSLCNETKDEVGREKYEAQSDIDDESKNNLLCK